MKRIFLTHTTNIDIIKKKNLSVAGYNFCMNLIGGGVFDKVYSILPSSVTEPVETKGIEYIVSNSRYGKFHKFAQLIEQCELFFKLKGECALWLYNVTIQNALLIVLLLLFKREIKIYVIVLDFTPSNSKFSLQSFYLYLTNKVHGRICLSTSDLFKRDNLAIIPGVVPAHGNRHMRICKPNKEFLLSGVLYENISMISVVLDVFSKLPECTLHITGFSPNNELIEQYTSKCSNIIFHGTVDYSEYIRILESVTYILSTRDPKCPENLNNFPSKIIESLLYNRAIISTISYPQLEGIRYYLIGSTPEIIVRDIYKLTTEDDELKSKYLNQEEAIIELCSVDKWRLVMSKLESYK